MTLGVTDYHRSVNSPSSKPLTTLVTNSNTRHLLGHHHQECSTMPCGFDAEPLDFDSAFSLANGVSDWPALRDPTMTLENRSPTIDSEANAMTNTSIGGKRKAVSEAAEDGKRSRLDNAEDENTPPGGEDFLLSPVRRKGPQLWSPKLRWKDERKRVLKISMNKLRTIDDPEMFLRRSVLINNTMKKLQKEIREEKTLRHLQDPFGPSDAAFGVPLVAKDASFGASDVNSSDNSWTVHQNSPNPSECRFAARRGCQPSGEVGASCDEIFGVNEDYLRINLPERLPPAMVVETAEKSSSTSGLATTAPSASTELTPSNRPGSSVNCGSTVSSTSSSYVSTAPSISCPCTSSTCSCSTRIKTNPRFYDPPVSRCCSTQYRNGPDPLYFGDAGSYCPHAAPPSCVDSVIYHSLMASLES